MVMEALSFLVGFIAGGLFVAALTEAGIQRLAHRLTDR